MAVAVKGGMLPFGSGSNGTADRRCSSRSTGRSSRAPRRRSTPTTRARATYAGAPAIPGVTVVRASTASYCLQAQAGTTIEHEIGPGGVVTTGAC